MKSLLLRTCLCDVSLQLSLLRFCLVGLGALSLGLTVDNQTLRAQSASKPGANRPPTKTAARPTTRPTNTATKPAAAPKPAPAVPAAAPAAKGTSVLEKESAVTKSVTNNPADATGKVMLRHRLKNGEIIRSRTTHVANTMTRVQGTEDISESKSISDKIWDVKSVDPNGQMTFEYRLEAVDMSQKQGNNPEITYNSRTDQKAPEIFSRVADTITKPIANITIDGSGTVIERDNQAKTPPLGMGEVAVPLPNEAVAIGAQWNIPRDSRVKLEGGTHKTIKMREVYTLEKVSAGVATIRVETQAITPIDDPSIDAQLMQQLSQGTIKFDIDRGRLISKQLDWDDEVVGFRGAETSLRYTARFTEETVE